MLPPPARPSNYARVARSDVELVPPPAAPAASSGEHAAQETREATLSPSCGRDLQLRLWIGVGCFGLSLLSLGATLTATSTRDVGSSPRTSRDPHRANGDGSAPPTPHLALIDPECIAFVRRNSTSSRMSLRSLPARCAVPPPPVGPPRVDSHLEDNWPPLPPLLSPPPWPPFLSPPPLSPHPSPPPMPRLPSPASPPPLAPSPSPCPAPPPSEPPSPITPLPRPPPPPPPPPRPPPPPEGHWSLLSVGRSRRLLRLGHTSHRHKQ